MITWRGQSSRSVSWRTAAVRRDYDMQQFRAAHVPGTPVDSVSRVNGVWVVSEWLGEPVDPPLPEDVWFARTYLGGHPWA